MHETGVWPAGWYPDPTSVPGQPRPLRWWDGTRWSPHVAHPMLAARPPKPPHPTLALPFGIGALAVTLGSLVTSRFVLDWFVRFQWPIAAYVMLAGVLGYGPVLLFGWWGSRRWGTGSLRADSGLFFRWADAGWGPVTWLACLGTQIVTGIIVVVTRIPITGNTEGVDDLSADRGYVIALLVLAVVAAPLVEEMVFRGVVLRSLLSRTGPVLAVAIQAVLFGMAHFDPVRGSGNIGLVLVLGSVGATLGGAEYLFRRIGPTIIAHAILNTVAMTLALSGVLDG